MRDRCCGMQRQPAPAGIDSRQGGQRDRAEPFGPYVLLRVLGRGGMGVVYVARSRLPDHPLVALKRLRADTAEVPQFQERFEYECNLARRLKHPRLVQVLDSGRVDGVSYMASELILGKDVSAVSSQLSKMGGRIPLDIAVRIMIDMLAGLDYLHRARDGEGRSLNLVHRDITPGNVIVGFDGISRLSDLGLAKSTLTEQLQLTTSGLILGTPKFMAPEVAKGEPATRASDLYGVGAVMYRLLAGQGPYDGGLHEVIDALLKRSPVPLADFRPDLPDWFVGHIEALMAMNPGDRIASSREAGYRLVKEAGQQNLLLPRVHLGQWLQDLFEDDCARQADDYRRERELDGPGNDTRTRALDKDHLTSCQGAQPAVVEDLSKTLVQDDRTAQLQLASAQDVTAPGPLASSPKRPAKATTRVVEATAPIAQPQRRRRSHGWSVTASLRPDGVTARVVRRHKWPWRVALTVGTVVGIGAMVASGAAEDAQVELHRTGKASQAARLSCSYCDEKAMNDTK